VCRRTHARGDDYLHTREIYSLALIVLKVVLHTICKQYILYACYLVCERIAATHYRFSSTRKEEENRGIVDWSSIQYVVAKYTENHNILCQGLTECQVESIVNASIERCLCHLSSETAGSTILCSFHYVHLVGM